MRAPVRAVVTALVIALLAFLVLSAGCKTTSGRVFGAASVVSAIGSGYLLMTSSTTIEDGMLVTHDDRQNAGVGLMFAAVVAAAGWATSEMFFGEHHGSGGGGGYAPVLVEPTAPAVSEAEAPAPEERPSEGPVVVVVQERDEDPRDLFSRGWRVDPRDGQHKFYAPNGELIGRIDYEGYVWDSSHAYMGRVDMSPGCGVACKRSQARRKLLGTR